MNIENINRTLNRFKLLALLADNENKLISGSYLAKKLNLTRQSIFKHINALKEEGLKIDSIPQKGYKIPLLLQIDAMSPTFINYLLKENDLFHTCLSFDETDSTQTVIKKLAIAGASQGIVATADYQNSGRGRSGRTWVNSKGNNLMFSILLRPKLLPGNIQLLNLAVGLAIRTVLVSEYSLNADLKWPNDILINDKKICGILSEVAGEPDKIYYAITGIGLNVNMQKHDFCVEIEKIATSILIESGKNISRPYLLVNILNKLSSTVKLLETPEGLKKILKSYKESCATLGKEVIVSQGKETHTGTATDITEQGALVVKINGKDMLFFAADIKHLRIK